MAAVILLGALWGCGKSNASVDAGGNPPVDSGGTDSGPVDAGPADAGPPDAGPVCTQGCPASKIEHLVLIVQENHSFDSYFGRYCTADAGSDPSCTDGPACCEAGPATDPAGATPGVLDDQVTGTYDPNHYQACELAEIDDGGMDRFAAGASCSNPKNVAYADATSVQSYWTLAGANALADRYFQPIAGASSSNDMYFARAAFEFTDNQFEPAAKGSACVGGTTTSFTDQTVEDLLIAANVSWSVYAGGYQAAVAAAPACSQPPSACLMGLVATYPCVYDPCDFAFEYYPTLQDKPAYMKDLSQLATDLAAGQLPSVSYVKPLGYITEHPGFGDTISAGEQFTQGVVDEIQSSSVANSTLVLITWDESGGYFDHISPPPASAVDGKPYGARVPLLAIGPFALVNHVSHVVMEHSSVVKFIEWNWLNQQTGQLGTRDAVVNNIGSLLDPAATGVAVPP